ncbi:MAG TPA: glycosyltransferase, partial [Tepidiformaceae bacterium]|nr:glycosyltransferase [Tepidiformaceae bacterium]
VVTGYPVRDTFFRASREEARTTLGIPTGAKVLLVAGASQGSQAINRAVFAALPALLESAVVVVHVTGASDIAEAAAIRETLTPELREMYRPDAYRDDLPLAMLAADLAVMRAGASVLGELPAAGLPSILVPGTFAGGHQRDNAAWLRDGGAAVLLAEAELDGFEPTVRTLLADPARLAAMRDAATNLARPNAANAIGDLILEVATR